jgi:hypothetical protein
MPYILRMELGVTRRVHILALGINRSIAHSPIHTLTVEALVNTTEVIFRILTSK